jgi:hypothetical protein
VSAPVKPQAASTPLVPLAGPSYHAMVLEAGNVFKVRPPVAPVNGQANGFFRFKNNTQWLAWLLLPPGIVDGMQTPIAVASHEYVEVPLKGGGTFCYVVVLHTDRGMASVPGESDPVIIIDPPAS